MIYQNYNIKRLISILLEENTHWADEVNQYNDHLLEVLFNAFNIDRDELWQLEEAELLRNLKSTYRRIRTPISEAFDATLALRKFPVLEDISNLYGEQKALIEETFFEVIVSKFPEVLSIEYSLVDLTKYGYDSSIEPNYDKLYEDY